MLHEGPKLTVVFSLLHLYCYVYVSPLGPIEGLRLIMYLSVSTVLYLHIDS